MTLKTLLNGKPYERPKKHQKRFYSGKQGEHTLKTQVVFGRKTNKIMCLAHSKGKTHDFKLFKNSDIKFHKLLRVIADKGYQGIAKLHNLPQQIPSITVVVVEDNKFTTSALPLHTLFLAKVLIIVLINI